MLLGCLGLTACATTQAALPLEIPLRDGLVAPCEQVAIPAEGELPPLAQSEEAVTAQIEERRFWMQRDVSHEGVERRICRQRDEAVALIEMHNQEVSRETN